MGVFTNAAEGAMSPCVAGCGRTAGRQPLEIAEMGQRTRRWYRFSPSIGCVASVLAVGNGFGIAFGSVRLVGSEVIRGFYERFGQTVNVVITRCYRFRSRRGRTQVAVRAVCSFLYLAERLFDFLFYVQVGNSGNFF